MFSKIYAETLEQKYWILVQTATLREHMMQLVDALRENHDHGGWIVPEFSHICSDHMTLWGQRFDQLGRSPSAAFKEEVGDFPLPTAPVQLLIFIELIQDHGSYCMCRSSRRGWTAWGASYNKAWRQERHRSHGAHQVLMYRCRGSTARPCNMCIYMCGDVMALHVHDVIVFVYIMDLTVQ